MRVDIHVLYVYMCILPVEVVDKTAGCSSKKKEARPPRRRRRCWCHWGQKNNTKKKKCYIAAAAAAVAAGMRYQWAGHCYIGWSP